MKFAAAAFALAAMIPAMTEGALAQAAGGVDIVLALCSGGGMALASGGSPPPLRASAPCCAKGCREHERRRKANSGGFDPAQ